jgi:hypothetical protein
LTQQSISHTGDQLVMKLLIGEKAGNEEARKSLMSGTKVLLRST